jgi:hypothetical protein
MIIVNIKPILPVDIWIQMVNYLISIGSAVFLFILTLNVIFWYFQTCLCVSVKFFILRLFIVEFASDILKKAARLIQNHGIIEWMVSFFLDKLLVLVLDMYDILKLIELSKLINTVTLVWFIIQFLRFSDDIILWDFDNVFILNFLVSVCLCVFVFYEFYFASFLIVGSELEIVKFVLNFLGLLESFLMIDCSLVLFKLLC